MSELARFLQMPAEEQVQDEWEVLHDPGKFSPADAFILGIASLPVLAYLLLLLLNLRYFHAARLVPFLVVLAIPLAVLVRIYLRPSLHGWLCLTNWRVIYYELGQGVWRNYHQVLSANLRDVVAVHSNYTEGWLGNRSLTLQFYTKFQDGLTLKVGETGGLLSKLPVIGILFKRSQMGADALAVAPVLFTLIQERAASLPAPSARY